jgi:hypothetical protein
MKHENILFIDRVRRKRKSFWYFLSFRWYYEDEKISLKEKIYTLHYNMNRTGYTTQGETDWSIRMMDVDYKTYKEIENQFKKDYIEYLHSKPNRL